LQPTPALTALAILAVAMEIYAWIFDDTAALMAGGVLILFAFSRGLAFQRVLSSTAASVVCTRSTENLILRQGGSTLVETGISAWIPRGAGFELTDMIPPGGAVIHGDNSVTAEGTGVLHNFSLKYRVAYYATGEFRFGGIGLSLKDPFFSARLNLTGGDFRKPAVYVEPLNQFSRRAGLEGAGEVEIEKITPLKGYGIRAFRLYRDGDDPRAIDWKLTAKHGKTYVREYAGLEGTPFLLVIDLPDPELTPDPGAFDQMLGAVNDAIMQGLVFDHACGLLLISGPNLIKFVPVERSTLHARRLIDEARRIPRVQSYFRYLEPSKARGILTQINRESIELTGGKKGIRAEEHFHRITEVYKGFLAGMRTPVFDMQVGNVIRARKRSVLYIFSLYQGDTSHLRSVVLQAKQAGCETVLQVPSALPDGGRSGELSRIRGVDTVVIR
jgi:uncharacterized protein (DUF58 family)